jgi:hypothetical protein
MAEPGNLCVTIRSNPIGMTVVPIVSGQVYLGANYSLTAPKTEMGRLAFLALAEMLMEAANG